MGLSSTTSMLMMTDPFGEADAVAPAKRCCLGPRTLQTPDDSSLRLHKAFGYGEAQAGAFLDSFFAIPVSILMKFRE